MDLMHCAYTVLLLLPLVTGLPLSRSYEHGPIALDNQTSLSFTIDRTASLAHFALRVTDDTVFLNASTDAWLGIGIGEPTSGHMPGSDIATVQFAPGETTVCALVDRHVPFAAHPLWVATPDSPAVFPVEDSCQDDGSWTLVSCVRDAGTGLAVFEVSRSLAAHDTQDRVIGPGFQNVLYAYGNKFGYHGPKRRRSTRIALYNDNTTNDPIAQSLVPLPDDVDGQLTVLATDYLVPSDKRTIYACTSKKVPVKKGQRLMVVATDLTLDASGPGGNPVHHLLVFLCSSAEYAAQFVQTQECTTSDDPNINGPLGNSRSGCSTLIAGYAKGSERQVFPPEAGVLVTEDVSYILIETHYENSELQTNLRDSSGVQVYTTSKPRTYEADSLVLGDIYIQLQGQPVVSGQKYELTCPSSCLGNLQQEVNVFGSFLHMHRTGQQIYTNRYARDLQYIETVNSVNFWNDKFQPSTRFDPPKKLAPGDVLQTMCRYDTSKRSNTTFGIGLDNEMCINILSYWPSQRLRGSDIRLNVCTLLLIPQRGGAFTECGDSANFSYNRSILWEATPAFRDPVGAPTTFGNEPGTCGLEASAEPDSEAGISGEPMMSE